MKLSWLGSESDGGESPTLYATDRGTLVIQGWKITDPEARAELRDMPGHEDAVEVPSGLFRFLPTEPS